MVIPDPGVEDGTLRLLPRKGGFWVVWDRTAPLGEGAMFVSRRRVEAERWLYAEAARRREG